LVDSEMIRHAKVIKVNGAGTYDYDDHLAVEEPLEIQLEWRQPEVVTKSLAVTMRTPGNDEELAAGFLFTEGIIKNPEQLKSVGSAGSNKILVTLAGHESPVLQKAERNFYTTSSCGVCGKSSMEAIETFS